MARFKVIGGSHVEDGKAYGKGDVVESSQALDERFVNKFERIGSESPDAEEPAKDSRGAEVTKLFPLAVQEDLCVFRNGRSFDVYEVDDLDTPLNTEGLKKTAVDGFIQKKLEEWNESMATGDDLG